jgi:hypothetical protein
MNLRKVYITVAYPQFCQLPQLNNQEWWLIGYINEGWSRMIAMFNEGLVPYYQIPSQFFLKHSDNALNLMMAKSDQLIEKHKQLLLFVDFHEEVIPTLYKFEQVFSSKVGVELVNSGKAIDRDAPEPHIALELLHDKDSEKDDSWLFREFEEPDCSFSFISRERAKEN